MIHRSDAGGQYVSLALSKKLLDPGAAGSIGRVGTAYDNALMESPIELYKSELIKRRAIGWDSRKALETATARWVAWFNRERSCTASSATDHPSRSRWSTFKACQGRLREVEVSARPGRFKLTGPSHGSKFTCTGVEGSSVVPSPS